MDEEVSKFQVGFKRFYTSLLFVAIVPNIQSCQCTTYRRVSADVIVYILLH